MIPKEWRKTYTPSKNTEVNYKDKWKKNKPKRENYFR